MNDAHPQADTSLFDSLVRIFEAGQRVILDRLDLAYFDLTRLATRTLRGVASVVIGAVLLTGAWFALLAGLVVWLQQYMSLPASLGLVAATSAAAGCAAIVFGVRRAQTGVADAASGLIEDVREGGTAAAHGAPHA